MLQTSRAPEIAAHRASLRRIRAHRDRCGASSGGPLRFEATAVATLPVVRCGSTLTAVWRVWPLAKRVRGRRHAAPFCCGMVCAHSSSAPMACQLPVAATRIVAMRRTPRRLARNIYPASARRPSLGERLLGQHRPCGVWFVGTPRQQPPRRHLAVPRAAMSSPRFVLGVGRVAPTWHLHGLMRTMLFTRPSPPIQPTPLAWGASRLSHT